MTDTLPPPSPIIDELPEEAPETPSGEEHPVTGEEMIRVERPTGWLMDADHAEAKSMRLALPHTGALLGARAGIPHSALVTPLRPRPSDQGSTSSCTGYAMCRAVVTRLLRMGYRDFPLPSEMTAYAWARLIAAAGVDIDNDDVLDFIPDEGAYIMMMIRAWQQWGISHREDWPLAGMSLEDAAVKPPPWDIRQKSSAFKVPGVYAIDAEPGSRADMIRQCIAKGYPVVFGAPIDPAFDKWKRGDAPLAKIAKGRWGGHAMCVDEYEGDVFTIPNSWGEQNGDFGLYRVTASFFEDPRVDDFTMITVAANDAAARKAMET